MTTRRPTVVKDVREMGPEVLNAVRNMIAQSSAE
jgi:hypothetical protein